PSSALHRSRGGNGHHRALGRVGAGGRLPAKQGVASRRISGHAGGGESLAPPVQTVEPGGKGPRSARAYGPRTALPGSRADREYGLEQLPANGRDAPAVVLDGDSDLDR